MNIDDVIWLVEIEDKIIAKHQVWPEEVEEVLTSRPHVRFMERRQREDEDLYAAFGQSEAGRYLTVYFIWKKSGAALVVTARDMTRKEKRSYGRRR